MPQLQDEIARRRTFAIISHPDAGKTTLTEKLLLCALPAHRLPRLAAFGERGALPHRIPEGPFEQGRHGVEHHQQRQQRQDTVGD
jgi:hypothetical protein